VTESGQKCSECIYTFYYLLVATVVEQSVNMDTVCGLTLFGHKLEGFSTTATTFSGFALPTVVEVPGGEYYWAVLATPPLSFTQSEGVAAVFNSCPVRHVPGEMRTAAPTPRPAGLFLHGTRTSNQLTLVLSANAYPAGPVSSLISEFQYNLSMALGTDELRVAVSYLESESVIFKFFLEPPLVVEGIDPRNAEQLSAELQKQFYDSKSPLYTWFPSLVQRDGNFYTDADVPPPSLVLGLSNTYLGLIIGFGFLLSLAIGVAFFFCWRYRKGRQPHFKPPPPQTPPPRKIAMPSPFKAHTPTEPSPYKSKNNRSTETLQNFGGSRDGKKTNTVKGREVFHCTAIHNYVGEDNFDDLSFDKNDELRVIDSVIEEGPAWIRAQSLRTGRIGLVPVSFVGPQYKHLDD
jgi:hypothetical protein